MKGSKSNKTKGSILRAPGFHNLAYNLELIGAEKAQAYVSQIILTVDLFIGSLEVVFVNGGVDVAFRGEIVQGRVHLLL